MDQCIAFKVLTLLLVTTFAQTVLLPMEYLHTLTTLGLPLDILELKKMPIHPSQTLSNKLE